MVHYHILMSGLTGEEAELKEIVRELWYGITGDSYIVDVRRTYEPARLANYLGKYLAKTFVEREHMEKQGWKRRYSSSRNWPKPEPLRLRGTEMDRWQHMERSAERLFTQGRQLLESSQGAYLMERVGTELVEFLYGKSVAKRELRKVEKWLNEYSNSS